MRTRSIVWWNLFLISLISVLRAGVLAEAWRKCRDFSEGVSKVGLSLGDKPGTLQHPETCPSREPVARARRGAGCLGEAPSRGYLGICLPSLPGLSQKLEVTGVGDAFLWCRRRHRAAQRRVEGCWAGWERVSKVAELTGADSVTDGMLPSVDGCLGPCVVASFVYFPPQTNHLCSACRSSSWRQKTLPELWDLFLLWNLWHSETPIPKHLKIRSLEGIKRYKLLGIK